MPTQIVMPHLGESLCRISRWLLNEGDPVEEYDFLVEVETDKVGSKIPSPVSGIVLKVLVPEGETVQPGTPLAWIGLPGEAVPPDDELQEISGEETEANSHEEEAPELYEADTMPGGEFSSDREPRTGFVSPVVERLSGEYHLDLSKVQGSGEGGRITKQDILEYMSNRNAAQEPPEEHDAVNENDDTKEQEVSAPGTEEDESIETTQPVEITENAAGEVVLTSDMLYPLSTHRQEMGKMMLQSAGGVPQATTVMEADLQHVAAHRHAHKSFFMRDGARLTYTAYFITAVVKALKAFSTVNASWTEDGIRVHPTINVGMVVARADEGMEVPVIKGADGLSLLGLARLINDLSVRSRQQRLEAHETQDATFTISNHGVSGSLFATPIIIQPQCAILGVGKITKRPLVINDAIAIRPMAYLSLTYDHRILDGSTADAFLARVVETLEGWV